MKRIFSVTVMVVILATMTTVVTTNTIPDADALKGKGVDNGKYGSATKGIVCGDMLCSEIEQTETSHDSTTKIKSLPSAPTSQEGILVDSVIGATMKDVKIDRQSGIVTVSVDAQNDGKMTVNLDSTINDVFMVIVDDEEWDDVFMDENKIQIDFYAGTEKIEILGSILG